MHMYMLPLNQSIYLCVNRDRRSSGLDNNNDVCNIERVWEEVLLACRRVSFVGHNCMMDLMFLSSQFESLPPNYYEFKEMVSMFHFGFFFSFSCFIISLLLIDIILKPKLKNMTFAYNEYVNYL
jgi:hypothetical protein